jgi:formylglycine-generating enzyme required for sulfatase activity
MSWTRMLICALLFAAGAPGKGRQAHRWDRVAVPAGPFLQGSIRGEEDERPARTTVLRAFVIDRTEVTRADYGRCVAARRCQAIPGAPAEADADAAGDAGDRLPVSNVSWKEAQAFCRFAGGRLPSEAEWEKAARGTDGREYPWGDQALCERANWGNFDGEGPCAGRNPGRPVAVGSYPAGASPYGVLDLGGNVWEWVADIYDDDPTRADGAGRRPVKSAAGRGGAGADRAERRVVRGGSCCSYFVGPRAANRNAWAPDYRDFDLGFRCASDR